MYSNMKKQCNLFSPAALKELFPPSEEIAEQLLGSRHSIEKILLGEDSRLLVIVGPCSIHDERGALEYGRRLAELARRVEEHLFIVMRCYFEKPRTSLGWRGLIYDPHLDGSNDIASGLKLARRILLELSELGLPLGSELLDPIISQYIGDLLSWAAIGARTTESQVHRGMASGLDLAVGFKNSRDGSVLNAINAVEAASQAGSFIGVDEEGQLAVFSTKGNALAHLILRGAEQSVNYDAESLQKVVETCAQRGLSPRIIIDCSHGNAQGRLEGQHKAFAAGLEQYIKGQGALRGMMLESQLQAGGQEFQPSLRGGYSPALSLTDPCLGWQETEALLLKACDDIRALIEGEVSRQSESAKNRESHEVN